MASQEKVAGEEHNTNQYSEQKMQRIQKEDLKIQKVSEIPISLVDFGSIPA